MIESFPENAKAVRIFCCHDFLFVLFVEKMISDMPYARLIKFHSQSILALKKNRRPTHDFSSFALFYFLMRFDGVKCHHIPVRLERKFAEKSNIIFVDV